MYHKIAIIPARSGSKGLKNKNIIDLNGKPLIAYSIEAAINSGCFDRVIVSTDSLEYAEISEKYGAEVLIRSKEASSDNASTYVVLKEMFERIPMDFSYFVLLQPTSPMRNSNHIKEAVSLFEDRFENVDFLVSVKEAEHAKVLVNPIEDDLLLKHFDTDFSNYKRQNYKDYSPNGAIFMGKPEAYLKKKHFFGDKSIAYIMSKEDSVDIDDYIDYLLAGFLMKDKEC